MTEQNFPPLDELISEINRKIDLYPESFSQNQHGQAVEDHHPAHKRRGNQFIRFSLNQAQFALPLEYTLEIMPKPDITPLPNLPGWIPGICNVRGEIVSVIELTRLLQIKRRHNLLGSQLIIFRADRLKTGLLVDKIGGIFFDGDPGHNVEEKALSDTTLAKFAKSTFVSSEYEIHLLDVAKLLPELVSLQ